MEGGGDWRVSGRDRLQPEGVKGNNKLKPRVMKNEAQLQHTQGEWTILAGGNQNVSINTKGKNGKAICITLTKTDEDSANAQRIVKAVNMHDELVDALQKCYDEFKAQADEGRYPKRFLTTNGGEGIMFISELLKQAE